MADSQLFLVRRESLAEHAEEVDIYTTTCSKCNRDLECELDTDEWTYADDLDYQSIGEPEFTRIGVYCRRCWENEDEEVVIALLGCLEE
jgi:hypothetical protein